MVVRLLWLSGRALAAQARGVLGPGFNSQSLQAFSLSPIFASQHLNSFIGDEKICDDQREYFPKANSVSK